MTRIIITGANGFIGRQLVKKILSRTTDSVILVSNTTKANDKYLEERKLLDDNKLKFYTADIRDKKTISQIMKHERADNCIHLAAKISVVDSINNPKETMDINVKGTLNVLEACYENRIRNFVFASSAAVYGDAKQLPISESHSKKPLSPYGTSKLLAEQDISSFIKSKKIQSAVILRIFNVYGYGQITGSDVITKFASRLSKGLAPVIYGGGIQTRDFISLDDVTDAFLLSIRAMENPENTNGNRVWPLVFNIGTGIPTSINQLAQKMISIFGLDLLPINKQGKADEEGIILHSYADMTKANKVLHFVSKKTIDMGLRELIESMLVHNNLNKK